jgi:hypothetical protein
LVNALRQVQHFLARNGHQNRQLLWVNQICINQVDEAENSHQVAAMGRIYSSAKVVLIRLPGSTGIGRKRFAWMRHAFERAPALHDITDLPNKGSPQEVSKDAAFHRYFWSKTLDGKFLCRLDSHT